MLIQLRVENHRSLRDEAVLSLVAASDAEDGAWDVGVAGLDERLLTVAAIWGANASGKSNVLHALSWMHAAVLSSFRFWGPDDGVPREPFAFRAEDTRRPSLFEVELVHERTRYTYGFTVDDKRVREEWLYHWPDGVRQRLFERDGDDWSWGGQIGASADTLARLTRPNCLCVSAGAQANVPPLLSVYRWFSAGVNLVGTPIGWAPEPTRLDKLLRQEGGSALALELLRRADLGIDDVRLDPDPSAGQRRRLMFRHRMQGADLDPWLPLERESLGTIALVGLLPSLANALERGGLLVVDELDHSLHPNLAAHIVELFQDPARNPRRAQLVFNTHDATLLGGRLGAPLLRRDQIWFTERDASGATRLYPLSDFIASEGERLQPGYLIGRYGAVPDLDDGLPGPGANDE